MIYTNLANLPAPLVSRLRYSNYDKVGDESVTGLIQPPRIRQLTKRHDNEIVVDVSEMIWRVVGDIGHGFLEHADTDNHLAEERLTMKVNGWTISGKPDLLDSDMTLTDYKFTSVWAVKDAKIEWEQQLNLYSLLYANNGFKVKAARIVAILRDWSKLKASREPDYPQAGVVVREVALMSPGAQVLLMHNLVVAHQVAELISDDDFLPLCTEQERWRKPDIWAVKKKGNKRALRLFDNESDARTFLWNGALETNKVELEHRPGEDTRCLHFCNVREFCSYGRTLNNEGELKIDN